MLLGKSFPNPMAISVEELQTPLPCSNTPQGAKYHLHEESINSLIGCGCVMLVTVTV